VAGAMIPKLFAPASLEAPHPSVETTTELIAAANPAAIAAAQRGMAARPDETSLIPSIDLPIAAIVGEHDALTPPAEAEAIAAAAPDATATMIPGAGHMAPVENPAAVADALRALLNRL
ncbi:MAG: alpha/beta hydrolase, partial [Planctomycetota bacterium]